MKGDNLYTAMAGNRRQSRGTLKARQWPGHAILRFHLIFSGNPTVIKTTSLQAAASR